jgi:rare lipoprotein A (peptidoglycan hydrolase)
MAVFGIFISLATANAQTGGVAGSGGTSGGGTACDTCELGDRTIAQGDEGRDVSIANYILRSKWYADNVPLNKIFGTETTAGTREFQQRKSLSITGIINGTTATELRHSMTQYNATWYGPGLYGNRMACGGTLTRDTYGVAHKTLPCGTKVLLSKNGKSVKTRVIDRGPFVRGITWDLTEATAKKLGFSQSSKLRAAVPRNQ